MAINNRYDFVMLFDVENGNPNGDPDMNNAPRIDFDTNYGYITDVCLKRKIRNYVDLIQEEIEGTGDKKYNILIKPDRPLNAKFKDAYEAEGLQPQKGKAKEEDSQKLRDYMCKTYFDVRTFGAVMSTGDNPCGIVRGPVQINFARSISPINIQTIRITRQARTTEARQQKKGDSEFGSKSFIPYGLYRAEGYVSACLANKVTDLDENDLELLWLAIINMFEDDHSAARGKMCMRKLLVFKHDTVLGCCPSHLLFDKVTVEPLTAVPRGFSDYRVQIERDLPAGVELLEKL